MEAEKPVEFNKETFNYLKLIYDDLRLKDINVEKRGHKHSHQGIESYVFIKVSYLFSNF